MSTDYQAGAVASRSSVLQKQTLAESLLITNKGEITEELPATVSAIGEINFTGNLIPSAWYQKLKLPSGRPDLVGCTLLGEIVYQYRPQPIRDEATGEVIHYIKRFTRDMFCAPVAYFTGKFGLTPDQVRQGLKRLESSGFITREYRSIFVAGQEVHGMTFVAPVPTAIDAITRPTARTTQPDDKPRPAAPRPVSVPAGAVDKRGGAVSIPLYKDTSLRFLPDKPTPPPASPQALTEPPLPAGCCSVSLNKTSEAVISSSPTLVEVTETSDLAILAVETTHQESSVDPETPALPPLVFDFHLTHLSEPEKAEFQQRLARLPAPLDQRVLDEYNSAIGGDTPIRKKWGWLEYLIRKALQGEFIPTSDLANRRQAQTDARVVSERTGQPERRPSAVWKAHRDELAQRFEPADFNTYVLPLRGIEEGDRLWLEAPNSYTVEWVSAHWAEFEAVLGAQTGLELGVRLESG